MAGVRIRSDEGLDPALPLLWDSVWVPNISGSAGGHADWAVADPEVETGNIGGFQALKPLETAIILCLFTDARRPDGVSGNDESAERRGWHGDTYDVITEDGERPLGSLLWTLERESLSAQTARLAEHYAHMALETLVLQGVVDHFDIESEINEPENRLALGIKAYAPDGEPIFAQTFSLE